MWWSLGFGELNYVGKRKEKIGKCGKDLHTERNLSEGRWAFIRRPCVTQMHVPTFVVLRNLTMDIA